MIAVLFPLVTTCQTAQAMDSVLSLILVSVIKVGLERDALSTHVNVWIFAQVNNLCT